MVRRLGLLLVLTLAANNAPAAPTAYYNPATGAMQFSDVGFPGVLDVASAGFHMLTSATYQVPRNPQISVDATSGPIDIQWVSLAFPFPESFDAGLVANPGTPTSDLTFYYASKGRPYFVITGPIIEVPELSTVALASLGALALIRRK